MHFLPSRFLSTTRRLQLRRSSLSVLSFILWTTPLLRGQGTDSRESLLPSMERYAYSNHRFTMEGGYGILHLGQKEFSGSMPQLGAAEVRWGFSAVTPLKHDLAQLDERFAFGAYMRPQWAASAGPENSVQGDLWRFGFGARDGYGYWPGNLIILPYFLWTLEWSHWHPDAAGLPPADSAIVARYDSRLCFGITSESGLKVQFGRHISIIAGYQFGLMYPRFVFPEWVASFAIIATAEGVTGVFTSGILRDAPWLTPVLHAVLKGAFAYGYYQLTRSDMNWPLHSETPLTCSGLKLGISIRF